MFDFGKYFPAGYKPSYQQDFILDELNKAYAAGYKFVVLNAPTGIGKSFIAKTLANSRNEPSETFKEFVESRAIYEAEDDEDLEMIPASGTAILTVTKTLQNQYGRDFTDGKILKGKSNYPCALVEDLPCDLGPCTFNHKIRECADCPYFRARNAAVAAKCSFYSYAMFMSLPPACRKKEFLICDEASEVEDVLVKMYSLTFNFKILKKLGVNVPPTPRKNASYEDYLLWLKTIKNEIFALLAELREKFRNKNLKREQKIKFKAVKLYNEHCDKLLLAANDTEFIVDHVDVGLEFKPYKVDKLANNLYKDCEFVVFMSATIIDHENFAKQLGIGPDDYYYIEAESDFDPKKAPIKLSDKIAVTYANKVKTIPQLAQIAKAICAQHRGQKGIIHTHSLDITKALHDVFGNNPRFIYREDGSTNEDMIIEHSERDDDTVLVSPSMTHGIDLKGKLGEFSIVMKAPFLPLGDSRIKRLCEEDKEWYLNKMLSNFIQICGRTVRSKKDTSITYVLDATLYSKLAEAKDKIPKYIRDRFVS